ncbi:MAG: beta-propeller domain-containing protein [Myxococcales bacterium]|nr:beta-propeller domain-containing protein [Myxococcales bacterium]
MSYKPTRFLSLLGVAGLTLLAAGCSNDEVAFSFDGVQPSSLQRAKSCNDLETLLKTDAKVRMNRFIDLQIASIRYYEENRGFGWGDDVAMGDSSGTGGPAEDGGTGGASNGGPSHSETNNQVEGVDEADIVKTDGEHIYMLHGATLTVLRSWPIAEMSTLGSVGIEGQPIEMFVEGTKAVVYSYVDSSQVLAQAGKSRPSGGAGAGASDACYDCYWQPVTKVTVIDIASMDTPQVLAEHFIEGGYVSARKIGTKIQTVVSGGATDVFQLYPDFYAWDGDEDSDDLVDAYEELRARNIVAIDEATLDDLLPDRFAAGAAGLEDATVSCEDVYVPTSGTTEFGVTQIHSLDLDNLGGPAVGTIVYGATHTIYQNHDNLVLAEQSWSQHAMIGPVWDIGDEPVSLVGTHLHVFALTEGDGRPAYRASATVPGALDDQFSLDEDNGVVRVATTEQIASNDSWGDTSNDLFTLSFDGRTLTPLGEVRNLAPGEQIYSTRYVGNRAYVVTFRQVDPLFVIDLADPASPVVVGSLKIPGFSEYMHPLGDGTHLFTIGVDGDWDGGTSGVALQIFDVSNPTQPTLAHKLPLSDDNDWAWTEALYNHKALTFYEDKLAFPVEGYGAGPHSGLAIFRVDPVEGITELGRIDHTPYFQPNQYDYCYYGYGVRRGVFIEDHVVSVSEAAVIASPLSDLTTSSAIVTLPSVDQSCTYYGEGI